MLRTKPATTRKPALPAICKGCRKPLHKKTPGDLCNKCRK